MVNNSEGLHIRIKSNFLEQLKKEAKAKDISLSSYVRECIIAGQEYLEGRSKDEVLELVKNFKKEEQKKWKI